VFVLPAKASRALLPDGFPFDKGDKWLKAISFGEEEECLSEEHNQCLETYNRLGIVGEERIERNQKFSSFPDSIQEKALAICERMGIPELPDNSPSNPKLRTERIGQEAADAPLRATECRSRAVSVDRDVVKQKAEQYLRNQYTNQEGEMICQVCKNLYLLPFKLDNDSYYFEKVEFLEQLKKRHYQDYLALCLNHRAMFKYANGSSDLIKEMSTELIGNELDVVLTGKNLTIYFTEIHIADLQKIIEVDSDSNEGNKNIEDSGLV